MRTCYRFDVAASEQWDVRDRGTSLDREYLEAAGSHGMPFWSYLKPKASTTGHGIRSMGCKTRSRKPDCFQHFRYPPGSAEAAGRRCSLPAASCSALAVFSSVLAAASLCSCRCPRKYDCPSAVAIKFHVHASMPVTSFVLPPSSALQRIHNVYAEGSIRQSWGDGCLQKGLQLAALQSCAASLTWRLASWRSGPQHNYVSV